MLESVSGLLPTATTATRPRTSDWSFLAQLAVATRQYVTRNPSVTGSQSLTPATSPTRTNATGLGTAGLTPASLTSNGVRLTTPTAPLDHFGAPTLRRDSASAGDQGGGSAAPVAPTTGVTPVAATPPTDASSTPVSGANGALTLDQYPRPSGDTGRGFDWIPTLQSSPSVVDNFVQKARSLGASWVTFLNDGSNVGQNDYLVKSLVANHIEPIMRIYTDHGSPVGGDLTGMASHYVGLGVHYFLPYNEPNLPAENPNGVVSVDSYVDKWISAARSIVAGGGMPGVGALAPAAPVDDVKFLQQTLAGIRQRGASDLLNQGWISVHNYTFNRPIDYKDDSNGFLKFQWYDHVAQQELGRSIPVISTEGGPRMGADLDPRYPAVDENRRDQLATATFDYLPTREPYFFAQTEWVLANEAGGGRDPSWTPDVLFKADGSPTPLAVDLQSPESQV